MTEVHREIIQNLLTTGILELVLIVILFVVFKFMTKYFSKVILIIMICELFLFSRGNVFTAPVKSVEVAASPIDFGYARYISTADVQDYIGPHVYWNHLRVRQPFAPDLSDRELVTYERLHNEINQLPGNVNIFDKRFNVSGYNAVVLENYVNYWDSKEINSVNITDIHDQRLSTLGVEYLVTGYPEDYVTSLESDQWEQVYGQDIQVYKNNKALQRAFISSAGTVELIDYTPEEVTFGVENNTQDKLIFTDSHYPGWKVFVNDNEKEIRKFEHAFRQVSLDPGVNKVTFRYEPDSVRIGTIISLISAIIILLLLAWPKKLKLELFS